MRYPFRRDRPRTSARQHTSKKFQSVHHHF